MVGWVVNAGSAPTGLFAHLEGCPECRVFLEALLQFRGAARRDRERTLSEADALFPAEAPLPLAATPSLRVAGARPAGGRARGARSWWPAGLPAPAAVALAALLLIAGIAIGVGAAARLGQSPQRVPDTEMAKQPPGGFTVVYVCAVPEIEVVAEPIPPQGD